MPYLILRFIVAALTFIIGVTAASVWAIRVGRLSDGDTFAQPTPPVLPQSPEQSGADLSAWQVLVSFENRDLSELDRPSAVRLRQAIDVVIGKPKPNEFPLVPRLISKISNAQGQTDYALIEEAPLVMIPGESRLHVHIFTLEGKLLSSSAFSSGWRIALTGVKVTYLPEVGREVVVVSSQPAINGRDIAKQYYALVGDKVVLIRLEDSRGQLTRNRYGAFDHPIGPSLRRRSVEGWEKALESDDTAEELSALMWLGGIHWDPRKPAPIYPHEEMREARLVEGVRSREGVKVALRRMMRSDNAWMRSAAELAARVEYYNG